MLFDVISRFGETKAIIRRCIHQVTYHFIRIATFPLIGFLLIIYYLCSAMNQLYYFGIIFCHVYELLPFFKKQNTIRMIKD